MAFIEKLKIISAGIFHEDKSYPFLRTKIALDKGKENVGTIVKDGRRVIFLGEKWQILRAMETGELKI